MARTKDALRHTGLAQDQLAEALRLVSDENDKVMNEINELRLQQQELALRKKQLLTALDAFEVDTN